ncbi:MAG: hypothetical protein JRJ59_05525 [Deltaproteobacteria bacterium]|nr:hypothetical protein [Deltaproteobacteria bacterium]
MMWIGPALNLPGLFVPQSRTFRGPDRLPARLKKLVDKDPDLKALLLPVEEAGRARAALRSTAAGTVTPAGARLAGAFKRVAVAYRRRPPQKSD